jgi:hypothetical protein
MLGGSLQLVLVFPHDVDIKIKTRGLLWMGWYDKPLQVDADVEPGGSLDRRVDL